MQAQKPSRWRYVLWLTAAAIVAVTMWFTFTFTETIKNEERRRVEIYAEAIKSIAKSFSEGPDNRDVTFETDIISKNNTIPMILTDSLELTFEANNFGACLDTNQMFLRNTVAELKKSKNCIKITSPYNPPQFVYYDQSTILKWLQLVPYGQLLLVFAFMLFGYLSFSAARRAEQNQIWIGLAKETAHQLGTPISGILGWLELLEISAPDNEEIGGIATEIRTDVGRLELVADRFGKIGAVPQLEPLNITDNLDRNFGYFKLRAARRIILTNPDPETEPPLMAKISPQLFDWVIENLLKNALDALDEGKGRIDATCFEDAEWVYIDIADTGKGIPQNKHNSIFQPGFTTKKRGWGLGLSLARRIVADYHKGKIFVKSSEVGKGTTFRIQLPK